MKYKYKMIPVSFKSLIDFSNIRKGPSLTKRVLDYNKSNKVEQPHRVGKSDNAEKPEQLEDLVEEDMECYKTTTDIEGNSKVITTYFKNKIGETMRRIREYRIETRSVKVSKGVAERRKWEKFGVCAGQGPGIDHTTNTSKEDVYIEWNIGDKVKDDNVEPEDNSYKTNILSAIGGQFSGIKCRKCGGSHMTYKCASSIQLEEVKKTSGKYTLNANKREDFSIRITNFPEEIEDSDIRNLFNRFGYIKRINLCAQRGFCFLSFGNNESCLEAVEKVNKHRYGYHVLSVEMADNKKRK
jgi:translation initiation factor 3 subunit G